MFNAEMAMFVEGTLLAQGYAVSQAFSLELVTSFSSCQRNLIKTFQIEGMIALITKMTLIFFLRLVKWPKIAVKKSQIFQKF